MENTQTETPINPLMNYARKPIIYISLPSNGLYNDPNSYEMSIDNEIGIAPMTTADELFLNNPDALLNGEAVASVIKSCVPGIKNVFNTPMPDIDALLLGIRLATYGDEMTFVAKCPKCEASNNFVASLEYALENIKHLDPQYSIKLENGLEIFVRPYTYETNVKQALHSYNEALLLRTIINDDLDEIEKMKTYQETFQKVAKLTVQLNADCIVSIIEPNGNSLQASDEQIFEWMENLPKKDAQKIMNKIEEINTIGVNKESEITCTAEECKHTWTTKIDFDPSYFFE